MTDNVLTPDGVAEERRVALDSKKNTLEEVRVELFEASRDVIGSYRRYSCAKNKVSEKRSARNLSRLSKAEAELGTRIDSYNDSRSKMQDALDSVVAAYDEYLVSINVTGGPAATKKSARSMNACVRKVEKYIEKADDSVACILSHYTLCIRDNEGGENDAWTQKTPPVGENSASSVSFVHTNEVAVSPVSIDIGPTVERAVERAISELSDSLEKRIAETVSAVEIPAPESKDTAVIVAASERLAAAAEAMAGVIGELDRMIGDVGMLVEKCRSVAEVQQCTAATVTEIEKSQRLVSEEQAQLIRAQATLEASLKETIKVQKSLLKSNSKCIEKLDRQTKKK